MTKQIRKVLSLLLTLVVLRSACFCSHAAESAAVIYTDNVSASAGETVSIPVAVTDNSGFMGFSLVLSFDDSVFTPVSVTAGDMLSNGMLDNSIGSSNTDTVKVVYSGTSDVAENGTLFTVDFEVSGDATGEHSIGLSYIQSDTFNESFEEIAFTCYDISVNINNSYIENAVKFYGGSVDATAGADVTVPVTVENSEGMNSFVLDVSYDSKVFAYVGVESGDILTDGIVQATEIASNRITLKWSGSSVTQNGYLLYLTFKIADYIEKPNEIAFSCSEISFSDGTSKQSVCYNSTINISNPYADEAAFVYSDDELFVSDKYVDVPVYINNNHGVMGFGINITYDSTVLQPASATRGAVTADGSFENNIGYNITDKVKIIWNNTEDVNENGLLFTVCFEILTVEQITALPIEISYSQSDTYNEFWEDVELDINISMIPIKYGYTAQFIADGVVISVQSFTSDTKALIEPEIPPKAGYIARWDYYKIEEKNLVINAKYDLPSALMISKQTLKVGDTTRLLPSCNFETTKKVWFSGNTTVATVDSHGNVTAVGKGKCSIKVICYGEDSLGNEIAASASTKIVVNEKSEAKDLKQRFREAFDEFFEVKLHDLLESLRKFMIVFLWFAY